jgi:hypothetical protein
VSYVKNEWGGGFTANVTVTNSGVSIAIAGAVGGVASGLAAAGYPLLALGGGILTLAIVPSVIITARNRQTRP